MYIYTHVFICVSRERGVLYIYIYRERDVYIYIYIYIYAIAIVWTVAAQVPAAEMHARTVHRESGAICLQRRAKQLVKTARLDALQETLAKLYALNVRLPDALIQLTIRSSRMIHG